MNATSFIIILYGFPKKYSSIWLRIALPAASSLSSTQCLLSLLVLYCNQHALLRDLMLAYIFGVISFTQLNIPRSINMQLLFLLKRPHRGMMQSQVTKISSSVISSAPFASTGLYLVLEGGVVFAINSERRSSYTS